MKKVNKEDTLTATGAVAGAAAGAAAVNAITGSEAQGSEDLEIVSVETGESEIEYLAYQEPENIIDSDPSADTAEIERPVDAGEDLAQDLDSMPDFVNDADIDDYL